jgi:hypothetical protein
MKNVEICESEPRNDKNKETGYIPIVKGKKRYKLYIIDIKKVFKLEKRRTISIPVFQEKNALNESTDADIEDNGEFEL